MAEVRPFHAVRYNTAKFADLAEVLAPPYDIIHAEEQQALYDRHPQNVIRLEYGVQTPEDTEKNNRYTRAQQTLADWLRDGTLLAEQQPCFYPHRQGFTWEGTPYVRSGFFAAVRLSPFNEGEVLPHEWTLKGPKIDRLNLMQTCLASFSPVFGLYDGRNSVLGELLAQATERAPVATAHGHGFDEILWCLQDRALQEAISEALSTREILIADGHHRYETMLALRDLLRERFPGAPANAALNYAFMLLVDLNDPGLLVLPTHRLLLLTPAMQSAFCRIAGEHFRLQSIEIDHPGQIRDILAGMEHEQAFIWYANGEYMLLSTPKVLRNGLPFLDVMALQEYILDPLFKEAEVEATVERNVRYTASAEQAAAAVDRGEVQGALFLNPTPVEDVLMLAQHGVRLPQKSTYFYPKVPTGLVMHNLQPDVTVG